ncbi:hypothetical protein TWF718_010071 [Orbilia javanica]|uniref:GLEYA adhesin domain-containing protein n=1 Tax=Orbilia javanica TaxID=47235 RepID=A0AAN8MRP2_9PEZI
MQTSPQSLNHSFLLLLLLLRTPQSFCQTITPPTITTSILFSTIQNPETIFITLNCPTTPLPRCESIQWGPFPSSTGTTILTPPSPMSTFVLHALEDGEHRYSLFDTGTQDFLLGPLNAPGTRLATLMLTNDGRLVNAENQSEVISVHPNITTPGSIRFHRKLKRQGAGFVYGIITYNDGANMNSSDIQSTFLFSDTDILQLQYGDTQYQSYKELQDGDRGVFNLYMGKQRSDANNIPTSLEPVELNGIDVTNVLTSSLTETRTSPTSNTSNSTPITTTGGVTATSAPTELTSSSGGNGATSTTMPTPLTTNPTGISVSSHTNDESSSSTLREPITLVNEVYRIITSLGYQWYCSSLLDSVTISDATSTTRFGVETGVSTVVEFSTASYEPMVTDYTIYTFTSGVRSSATTVQNTVPNTGWRKGMKFIRAERQVATLKPRTPVLPASLSAFEAGVITEACEKAIVPTTKTETKHVIITHPETTSVSIRRSTSIASTITGPAITAMKTFLEPIPTSTYTFAGVGKVFMKDQKPLYGYKDLRNFASDLQLVAVNQDTQPADTTLHAYPEWTLRYNISDQYYYLGRRPATLGSLVWALKKNPVTLADYAVQLRFYDAIIGRYMGGSSGDEFKFDVLYINYESSNTAPIDERYTWTPDVAKGMPANGRFYSCQYMDTSNVIHSMTDSRALFYLDLDKISDSEFRALVDGAGMDGAQCIPSTDNKFQFYSPTLQAFPR